MICGRSPVLSSMGKKTKQDRNWWILLRFFFLPWLCATWKLMMSRKTSKMCLILVCVLFTTLFILLYYSPLWVADNDTTGRVDRIADSSSSAPNSMQATVHNTHGYHKGEKINPHDFAYVINEEETCSSLKFGGHHGSGGPFLLIFVLSSLRNFERRLAIRQSWGNRKTIAQQNVRLLFLTGVAEDGHQEQLLEESSEFGDIVQEDFIDSYMNLTLKSVMGLKWMTNYCPMAEFVMKTDDDIYVNVALLVDFLRTLGARRRWIGGCIKQIKSPLPFNRHGERVSSMTIGHPPFAAGAGYVISGDLVPLLYEASLRRRSVPVEDAFVTAYCALMVGVTPEHDDRFNCGEPVNNDCQMAFKFVGHHVTPERQLRIFSVLNGSGNVCKMLN